MQNQITSIPGYRVFEYLLVLQPHEELRNQILRLKKEFAEKYRAALAIHTKPHIALVNFQEESHFTICRKLKPWQFEQGWVEYSHRHFSGRFIADSFILLCRPVDEMKYEAIMRFEFQGLTVNTKQASLFV
ncbi:MAG: hypothetical protein EON98_16460 [Chitinophagaceae bacterium]|nr:MAG: hypothetical protein EON98_16460 [Chitinophagaceae bacterium]